VRGELVGVRHAAQRLDSSSVVENRVSPGKMERKTGFEPATLTLAR
jgi:hypothetical protein